MTSLHNLRAFHIKVQKLVKNEMRRRDAWETVEKEYFAETGRYRYKNYGCFRQVHWQVLTGNYKHLNK